jgi:hypothetical protein
MDNFAERLHAELKAAGLNIIGVSIGSNSDTSTWTAQPSAVQAQAQPIIDAIDLAVWAQDEKWADLRVQRNAKLDASDWTHVTDSPLASDVSTAWAVYRQELRDLPGNTSNPDSPVWPTPPGGVL